MTSPYSTLPTTESLANLATTTASIFGGCGFNRGDSSVHVRTPITGATLGGLSAAATLDDAVSQALAVKRQWASTPAPVRGELIRVLGELLRAHKADLATLVTIETGKIRSEALGEVQEMIDICDFAVGLSRQLYGKTIASERPEHRLAEYWQPLGVVGVISAFNFPVAVWSWNAALAIVCGNPVIWKPSEKTVMSSAAVHALALQAAAKCGAPDGLFTLVFGGADVATTMADHPAIELLSATGSTAMGRALAPRIAARFGRALLELGGNNAAIVTQSADLNLAVRGITFSAAGTAGQRCTTLRRLIVHSSIVDQLVDRVATSYRSLPIGDPLADGTLVGPLIDGMSFERLQHAIAGVGKDGGTIVTGGDRVLADQAPDGFYAQPAIAMMPSQTQAMHHETFGPLLYVLTYDTIDEAIALNNAVPQGLASSIFTTDMREAERFTGPLGSDCGIVNVNIGPSGAEIGGAFGGEKETGGGRESGSDSWRAYMRRVTSTTNFGNTLPLAQGVEFG